MFVVSEDDTYSGYGLEQLSQVFTVKEHRQLAASDVRGWLIAVGKALQKRRLIEKANAWARFITGVQIIIALPCHMRSKVKPTGKTGKSQTAQVTPTRITLTEM